MLRCWSEYYQYCNRKITINKSVLLHRNTNEKTVISIFLSCFSFNFLGQIPWCQTWTSLQDQTKFSLSWGNMPISTFITDFPCQLLCLVKKGKNLTHHFVFVVVSYQLLLSFLLVKLWGIVVTGTEPYHFNSIVSNTFSCSHNLNP